LCKIGGSINLTQTRERIHNYNDLDSFIPSSELNSNTPDDQASKNYSLLNNVRDTSLSVQTQSVPSGRIGVKYHWFQENLVPEEVEILSISSSYQLADIFTKRLSLVTFE
jgi:hypothetical protein